MKHWAFIFFIVSIYSLAQTETTNPSTNSELGIPYMQHYEPKEYGARPDNQAIVQGDNGLMYFGNSNGVLEYDGINWRMIHLPNRSLIKTLVRDEQGTIFVGGFNELGYLQPDSLGFTVYHSLKSELDLSHHNFNYLRNSFIVGKAVYFQSGKHLFRWLNGAFKIWSPETEILFSTVVDGNVFVQLKDKGLYKLVNDELQFYKRIDNRITSLFRLDDQRVLLSTIESGLYAIEGSKITPYPTEVDEYLKKNLIRHCRLMPNGWLTLGTNRGGLVVIDKDGSFINILDKSAGLLNNDILAQYLDHQGGLWLGLNHGIARIELLSPYSIFDERLGVTGFINNIVRYKGQLYAGSIDGLLRLNKAGNQQPASFVNLKGSEATFYLAVIDEKLFTATFKGSVIYKEGEFKKLTSYSSGALLQSRKDPSIIYVGLIDGLGLLKKQDGSWIDYGKIEGIEDDIREFAELEDGKLWMESQIDGVWLVDFYATDSFNINAAEIRRFQANKELPQGWLFLHYIRGEALFEIQGVIYKYKGELDSIMPYKDFGVPFGFKSDIVPKLEDEKGNIWMSAHLEGMEEGDKQRTVSMLKTDGSYEVMHINDNRITHSVKKALYPEDAGILWYGGPDGIIRQDLNLSVPHIENFKALIRKISIDGDSIIYGGSQDENESLQLQFANNTIRFEYAAPSYDEISRNQYQYFLEGYDEDWSDWTDETKKDYTQIPEGEYTFKIRSKNIYQQFSSENFIDIKISPPWFRSWWAYVIYIGLFILSIFVLLNWRSRQLKAKNEMLETIVATRTAEVQHQANQLKIQAEKLLELDRAKSRFFANISHEFRTPLTLIKGPIEQLEHNFDEKLSMENVKMIRRSANRVLNMVNQLLDLSRLDEGNLKLSPTEGDVYRCLRAACSSFNSHAAQRNIDYKVLIPQEILWTAFDRDKLENIVYNLLINAFKFSVSGSTIMFIASYDESLLQILVSDSGKGIPKEKLPFIFDRFYQVDDSNTREQEGSGIGLSLSKDLVELMGGSITVDSTINIGTEFTIQIPLQEIRTGKELQDIDNTILHDQVKILDDISIEKEDLREVPSILMVEDNADMRHFIKEQLISSYKVIEATNGEIGFKKSVSLQPDLIITDLMMPKMDGIELCRRLKTNLETSHIPVIMLTAKAGIENKIEGLETGADDYLTKPFDSKELLARSNNLIKQRKSLRELFSRSEVNIEPRRVTVNSIDQKFLESLIDLLESNFSDPDFGVPQIQENLAMSKTQLHRKVKALTNEPPGELLRNYRLKHAAQLLSQKADSVTQIAYMVGFNNLSYFAKCFKGRYGMAPSLYNK